MDASSVRSVAEQGEGARFRAFVSYSHQDAAFASKLQRRLETYRLPRRLLRGDPALAAELGASGGRIGAVFRDEADLSAAADLSEAVRAGLAASRALVVVCSPAAVRSQWVAREIALFRELHPDRSVLAALVEGEPAEAFPPALTEGGREPLAADFRDGRDGWRLGLLKTVAGILGVPLDQLVQRDAQARQRRVTAVTAASFALSLVLAAMLLFALRARAEAERQRAEAEGLVEFMLTDLRDKLKGVGRLDVMDAVNQRAMAHYNGDTNLAGLPDSILLRRAKLLQAMADDDMNSTAHRDRGKAQAAAAWRITSALLQKSPNNPEHLLAHAQSEYYQGYAAYITKDKDGRQQIDRALGHFEVNAHIAAKLVTIDPDNPRWIKEKSSAEANLCAIYLTKGNDSPIDALPHCRSANEGFARLVSLSTGQIDPLLSFANSYGWLADCVLALGRTREESRLRRERLGVARKIAAKFPDDARAIEAELQAMIGLIGTLKRADGDIGIEGLLEEAANTARILTSRDSKNLYWQSLKKTVADFK